MVQDGAGRTANAVLHVTVTDLPPPMVQITTPAEGATVGGTITVAASLATAGPRLWSFRRRVTWRPAGESSACPSTWSRCPRSGARASAPSGA